MTNLATRKSRDATAPKKDVQQTLSVREREALQLLRELARQTPKLSPVRPDQANRYVRP